MNLIALLTACVEEEIAKLLLVKVWLFLMKDLLKTLVLLQYLPPFDQNCSYGKSLLNMSCIENQALAFSSEHYDFTILSCQIYGKSMSSGFVLVFDNVAQILHFLHLSVSCLWNVIDIHSTMWWKTLSNGTRTLFSTCKDSCIRYCIVYLRLNCDGSHFRSKRRNITRRSSTYHMLQRYIGTEYYIQIY